MTNASLEITSSPSPHNETEQAIITFGPTHKSFGQTVPEIHTSDRSTFRRCRRKWYFQSPLRLNMQAKEDVITPLWVGTGCHTALEDFHGHNYFGHPTKAWQAYVFSFPEPERPPDWEEQYETLVSVLNYYADLWLPRRQTYQTLWIDGQPQVEVHWKIPILDGKAQYVGTFDRVVTDTYGNIFAQDYKFVRKMDTKKLDIDQQITAYTWAGKQLYGDKFKGIVYHQFCKEKYEEPKRIKNGFSKAKTFPTTYEMYKATLMREYGHVPPNYNDFVDWLMTQDSPEGDLFIRYDEVRRNDAQLKAEGARIKYEAADMINRKLPLYPNPTMTCGYECKFKSVCVAMDDGTDWQWLLRDGYERRPEFKTWQETFGRIAMKYKEAKDRGETYTFVPPKSTVQRFDEVNILLDDILGDDAPPWN